MAYDFRPQTQKPTFNELNRQKARAEEARLAKAAKRLGFFKRFLGL